jgi:hemolysin activation/secretion protein
VRQPWSSLFPACREGQCVYLKKLFILLVFCTGSLASVADDQSTSTPANASQPTQAQPGNSFILPPVDIAGQASPGIEVASFQFEGNTVFSTEVLQKLIADYIGRRLSATEFEEIRNRITHLYIDQGHLNSGALLTPSPESGHYPNDIVPIRIVEGRVESVNIKGEDGLHKRYIEDRLVRSDELLNVNVLQERFRLLLTDPLFDRINSRIIPGDAPGKAVLDVDIVRALPYSLSVFANNYRPPSIGSEAIGVSGWVRNLSGHGDVLDATLQHSEGADPVHLGWAVPLGAKGASFRASYDRGTSSVIEESLRSIDIKSLTSGYELGLGQTLVDTLARKVDLGLSYGERRDTTTLLGEAFSFTPGEPDGSSKVKVWRFSQDWTERREKQALALRSVFAFGRNNVDLSASGGTSTDPVKVADPHYAIWIGQVQYVQTVLDNGAQILLRGATQYTRDRLLPLEQFSIGGVGTVRGYRENAVLRDRAYVASAEFHYPLWLGGDDNRSLTLISFTDFGRGWNQDETQQTLSSVGLGMSWRYFGISADLYLAHKMSSLPVETSGNLQDHGIHFQIGYKVF